MTPKVTTRVEVTTRVTIEFEHDPMWTEQQIHTAVARSLRYVPDNVQIVAIETEIPNETPPALPD